MDNRQVREITEDFNKRFGFENEKLCSKWFVENYKILLANHN